MNRVNYFINLWRKKILQNHSKILSVALIHCRRTSFLKTSFLWYLIIVPGWTEGITSFWSGLHSRKSDHSFHMLICFFVHRAFDLKFFYLESYRGNFPTTWNIHENFWFFSICCKSLVQIKCFDVYSSMDHIIITHIIGVKIIFIVGKVKNFS